MSDMREIKVGVRIEMETGVHMFGADAVNDLISQGWSVESLQPGGVVFLKTGSDGENVQLVISGCDLKVVMRPPQNIG